MKKHSLQLIFLVLNIVMLLHSSCSNDLKDIPNLKDESFLEYDRAKDVTFIMSQNGSAKAELFAKEFMRNDIAKPPFVDLSDSVHVNFFNDSLVIENTLSAKYARYYPESGDILVRDSIIIINKKGETLETDELVWNEKLQKFYTDKEVRITRSGQITTGEGMESNQDFSWFRIYKQKGIIEVEDNQFTEED